MTIGREGQGASPCVLALDLSITATGFAAPDGTLSTYRPSGKGDGRLCDILEEVEMAVADPGCSRSRLFLVIEDLPMGIRNAAAGPLGMLHGAVRVALMREDVPYLLVPPASLKTYATGRGNAQKPDLRMELYKRTGADVADDNQVDAAWLRLLALDLAGHAELDLPQTHRRALDKLTLPSGAPT